MPKITISKIKKIKGLHPFANCPPESIPDLKIKNLIYGFNGVGKTTLSRVFQAVADGEVIPPLASSLEFVLELTDGSEVRSNRLPGSLHGRVVVFNEDFQSKNLRWREGTANPVFYLGKDQADLLAKIEEVGSKLEVAESAVEVANTQFHAAEAAFSSHKTDAARTIAEVTGLGRRYNAGTLGTDYGRLSGSAVPLANAEVAALKATIAQSEPLPALRRFDFSIRSLELVERTETLLTSTLGERVTSNLDGHEDAFAWIKEGMRIHRDKSASECLFCEGQLGVDRMELLGKVVDAQFDSISSEARGVSSAASALSERAAGFLKSLPSQNDLVPAVRDSYENAKRSIEGLVKEIQRIAAVIEAEADRKLQNLGVLVAPSPQRVGFRAADFDRAVKEAIEALNEVVIAHNTEVDEFSAAKMRAVEGLRVHLLVEGRAKFVELSEQFEASKVAKVSSDTAVSALRQEYQSLSAELRKHGPAADKITALLNGYLGRTDLVVSAVDAGYQLKKSGQPVQGTLSEGERTAVAFCYFLASLEAEGRRLEDLIVVLDDPVSSLDTRALNYSFGLMKLSLQKAAQLVVLTHNLNYMNEVKKWLKPELRRAVEQGREPDVALMFLDSRRDEAGVTSTKIINMPKHIREYEAEYHYLFSVVDRFLAKPVEMVDALFLMPNAMRKVGETFLAFRFPGNDGLSSKLEKVSREFPELDGARIVQLDRLINVESHGDSLDDLVTMSSPTVEEATEAAATLIEVMKALDNEHLVNLRRVCR